MLFRPIRFLADRFNVLQMGLVASNRVFDLLDKDFVIEDEGQNEQPLKGKVVFDKVDLAMSQKSSSQRNIIYRRAR